MNRPAVAALAVLTSGALLLAYDAATPDTTKVPNADVTWSDYPAPTPSPSPKADPAEVGTFQVLPEPSDEDKWRECVDWALANEPTDAVLQSCDAAFGEWDYRR